MNSWHKWLIVIPARLASTRLFEKPLADLAGRPLVLRVFDRIRPLADLGAEIVVATDHEKIAGACRSAAVPVHMTREDHPSGTDRCAEVAQASGRDYILNVQGDEPFIDLDDLQRLMAHMEASADHHMGTLVYRNQSEEDFHSPNVVKVVVSGSGTALYFSRAPIPYRRDEKAFGTGFWQHLGIYAYKKAMLKHFCSLPLGLLERTEKLEQLRAIEWGSPIHVIEASHATIGIDTPEDLAHAATKFK